ncbi:MAG: PAS domain S-box protein [Bacillota bacterium]
MVKNRQKVVFNQSPIAICIADFHLNFVDANKKYCELVGYNLKELKEKTYLDITKENHKSKNLKYTEAMKNGNIEYFELEKTYIKKDGSEVDVSLKVKLISDYKGEPVFIIAFIEKK